MLSNSIVYISSSATIKTVSQCRKTQQFVSNSMFILENRQSVTDWINMKEICHLYKLLLINASLICAPLIRATIRLLWMDTCLTWSLLGRVFNLNESN